MLSDTIAFWIAISILAGRLDEIPVNELMKKMYLHQCLPTIRKCMIERAVGKIFIDILFLLHTFLLTCSTNAS